MPETAALAVADYDAQKILDVVSIVKGGTLAEQQLAWKDVFDILRKATTDGANFEKNSYLQFESWCFRNRLAIPTLPGADTVRTTSAKATAYSIMREGFSVYVARNIEAQKIQVRKA